mgnify:FL=1
MRDRAEELVKVVVAESLRAADLKDRTRDAVRACCPHRRPVLISIGKASASMAEGALSALTKGVEGGVVVAPRGVDLSGLRGYGLEIMSGGHPLPDESSLSAGQAVLEWARESASRGVDLLVLVSGGSSALVESPLEGLDLDDLVQINKILLNSGASISEINTVRRHVSKIKGGGLVKASRPSRVYGLYASDVPGDNIHDIGSGPTAPDPTTFRDALTVLELYGITSMAPVSVVELLRRGASGLVEETLKPGSPDSFRATNVVIARNLDVLESVEARLRSMGFNTLVLTSMLQGESREVGKVLASLTAEVKRSGRPVTPPAAIILGGETSVTVRGKGRGGRNQELALSWVIETKRLGLSERDSIMVALATDGIDGPTDAAGAAVTPGTFDELVRAGYNPLRALTENDSYSALELTGSLIKTGLTGTNLNNVIVVFVW